MSLHLLLGGVEVVKSLKLQVLIEIRSMRMSEGLTGVDEPSVSSVSLKYDCEVRFPGLRVLWASEARDFGLAWARSICRLLTLSLFYCLWILA